MTLLLLLLIFGKVHRLSLNEPSPSVSASVLPHFKGVGELCNLCHGSWRKKRYAAMGEAAAEHRCPEEGFLMSLSHES